MKSAIKQFTVTHGLVAALATLGGSAALAQTSPARGALQGTDDVPLADYLGLLQQIAPAAEEGANAYLLAFKQRCGRVMRTAELRLAMTQGEGDPVLMGLIRASHLRDAAAREQLIQKLRCPAKEAR